MPATALARRLLFASLLFVPPAVSAAQQLGNTFTLDEQQTAVAHVDRGQFVRVRLRDGARAGGPLIRATPVAFVVGPSVAFSDQDRALPVQDVDSMWVRVYSTRRGMAFGALLGAAAGLVMGTTASSVCPVPGSKPCTQGAVTSLVGGMIVGGAFGALLGSGRSRWRRLLPRYGTGTAEPTGSLATLVATGDTAAFDPRALTLMRVSRDRLLRLTFEDRGDLGAYVLSAGARGATVGVVSGHPGDAPIPLLSLEGIWERGTAERTGSAIGVLAGALAGVVVATQSSGCDPHSSCKSTIFADGVGLGALGYFLGGRVGHWFPQWHRRYSS